MVKTKGKINCTQCFPKGEILTFLILLYMYSGLEQLSK